MKTKLNNYHAYAKYTNVINASERVRLEDARQFLKGKSSEIFKKDEAERAEVKRRKADIKQRGHVIAKHF